MAVPRGKLVIIDNFTPFYTLHAHSDIEAPSESPDGVRVNFSTSQRFKSGSLEVYENGVHLKGGEDYTEDTDRLGYTLNYAPRSGALILHKYLLDILL